jgi:subtilase family serine protease
MRLNRLVSASIALALAIGTASAANAPQLVARDASSSAVTAAAASDTVEFSVYLPLRNQSELEALVEAQHDNHSAKYQQWLTPDEFMQRFGPTAAELKSVRSALEAHGLTIVSSNGHGMRVKGSASAVTAAFKVGLNTRMHDGHRHFMTKGNPQLPNVLAGLNVRVMGLEAIPDHQRHSKITGQISANATPDNRYGTTGPYWFTDLKQAYDYPAYSAKTDGSGVSVAILMSDLLFPDDVQQAFDHEKFTAVTGKPAPSVTTVPIDGGGEVGGPGSFEASLDVQQVLGGAPGTAVTLVSIPDLSDDHIMDGYAYIIDQNKFDLVNSSFGECELEYTAAYNGGTDYTYILQQYHELFMQGNAQGITFVASSGDQGGIMCPTPDYGTPGASPTFGVGVSTPSGDPNVTSVGGGNLITVDSSSNTSLNSSYTRESAYADPLGPYDIYGLGQNVSGGVWAAGGGISTIFRKPLYQLLTNTGSFFYRTQPDVGMQVGGCPAENTISCGADDSAAVVAYGVGVGGGFYGVIGTSVSSPEFVGALALYEQQLGKKHRMGNANYFIYAQGLIQSLLGGTRAPSAFQFYHRNNPGNDGYWDASHPSYNYNYIYGNGTPDVRKLFGLTRFPAAGNPQTATNP